MKKSILKQSKILPVAAAGVLLAGVLAFTAGDYGSARNFRNHNSNSEYVLEIEGLEEENGENDTENATLEAENNLEEEQNGATKIKLLSYGWSKDDPGIMQSTGENGGGAGDVMLNDLYFSAKVNEATPLLMQAAASGQPIPEAVLKVNKKSWNGEHTYLMITMTDVLVSSYQNSASHGKTPVDNASLNFGTVEMEYQKTKDSTPVVGGWDFLNNIGL